MVLQVPRNASNASCASWLSRASTSRSRLGSVDAGEEEVFDELEESLLQIPNLVREVCPALNKLAIDADLREDPTIMSPHESTIVYSRHGSFQLGDKLGEGSFGKVYACTDVEATPDTRQGFGRCRQVIKVLRSDGLQAGTDFRTHVGHVLQTHDSPVLPLYHELFVDERCPSRLLVRMEMLPGETLADWMDAQDAVSERSVGIVATQLLEALKYLHSRNLMHRDVKPDNIMVTNTEVMSIKLFDFGSGALIDPDNVQARDPPVLTRKRAIVGGYGYVAPEALSQHYSQLVDVWATGVVVYELFSAFVPFEFGSIDEYRTMIERGMRVDLQCDPFPLLSDHALEFLAVVLTMDPAERPTAAAALELPWIRQGSQ